MANKAIKYRLYPTTEQKTMLTKTFGCCRKIYNLMLADKIAYYKSTGKSLMTTPAQYKKEYPFLKEVDSLALANEQLYLQTAYRNFFRNKKIGFPKFKSAKRDRKSYTTNNQNGTITIFDKAIKFPKIGKVKAVIHRTPPEDWKVKSATVSLDSDGKYYASVLFKYEQNITLVSNPECNAIGFDYKSDGLFTDSNGNTLGSPKYFRKSQHALTRAQRKLRHKQKGSRNYQKACAKIAKKHRHIANQRKDFLHKLSAEIANQYDMVCVESLNMKAMSNKGFGNGKATLDNGYGMFLSMLEYKLADRGKILIRVDKWYASSQICSCCGEINPAVKDLSIRKWQCPACGCIHDRDINAANNILSEGIREYLDLIG